MDTGIIDFVSISIIGAVLSVAFQYFKTTSGTKSKVWAIGLSILVGGVYVVLRDTSYWTTILGVLASASTVYALFLKE